MRNAFGPPPPWRRIPYLQIPTGGSWQLHRLLTLAKPNESPNKNSSSLKCQRLSQREDERKCQGNFLPLGWETDLKGGWSTSWLRAWKYERKPEYYHIIFSPENTWDDVFFQNCSGGGDIFHQEKRGQIKPTLQQDSLPQLKGSANKHHKCQ